MTISRPMIVLAMASAAVGGAWIAAYGPANAQESGEPVKTVVRTTNVADAMLLPIRLPFAEPISLEALAAYLRKELKANVVLDLAALGRHDVEPTATVRLELIDVRLKTGLKLLLDQVGLVAKVLPEDNLLIFTDKAESDEPLLRVLDEIKALHRDVHSLQDDVRDLRSMLDVPPDDEPVARMRNPTIIEEKPAKPGKGKVDDAEKHKADPRARPGA